MSKIKVFTDSTCDLPHKLIVENDISVLPLYVTLGEEIYRDGVDITGSELLDKVENSNEFPSTSAVSPEDYYQAFKKYVDEGKDVIYIGLSSQLSSSLQNAILTATRFPENRVNIIDSNNLSTGIGLLALKAVDYVKSGFDTKGVVDRIKGKLSDLKTEFIPENLEFIHKGGRCSSLQNFLSSMLRIRPILKVEEGKVVPGEKVRGSKKRALKRMVSRTLDNKDTIDPEYIFIPQAKAYDEALFIKDEIEKAGYQNVIITEAGSVISTHSGPGTVGIIYIEKED